MGSYIVAQHRFRQARYRSRPLRRRQGLGLKAALAAVPILLTALLLSRPAYGGGPAGTETLVVRSGDSLWSIATSRYPEGDPRAHVDAIVRLNHLGSRPIYVGERITVPAR